MPDPAGQERFVSLVDEHRKILYKVASAYCRNPADRPDLVQEMVVQLWRAFERYDDRYRFSTWMYRIALNVAISFYRSETRRTRPLVPAEESILEIAAEPPGSAGRDEGLLLLQSFIEQLDEMERALLILHLEGNAYQAISEILGISETNVGTKLSRVKQKLRLLARAV